MGLKPHEIAAGSTLIGSAFNAAENRANNYRNTAQELKNYRMQRTDSLKDWNMQNEYNSPQQQMARLKAAGLNPNLVYGNGATTEGASFKSPDLKTSPHQPSDYSGIGQAATAGIEAYNDTRVKDAQINQINEQINVMKKDQSLKEIDFLHKKFDLDLKGELRQNSLDMAIQQYLKLQEDTNYTRDSNARANELQPHNVEMITAQVSNMMQLTKETKHKIELLKQSKEMNELDLRLKRKGIQPTDNIVFRAVAQALDRWLKRKGATAEQFVDGVLEAIGNWLK